MKINLLLLPLLLICNNFSIAQKSWLGVPLLDKNIRLSECPICKSNKSQKSLETFSDSLFDNFPIQRWKNPEYFNKNIIYLNNLKSTYKDDKRKLNIILHLILELECNKKEIYYDELNSKDVIELSSFFDTLISLNPNSEIETYYHQKRIKYFLDIGALDKVKQSKKCSALKQQNISWYIDDNLKGIQDKDWLRIAKIYVDDHKKAGSFHLFNTYNGLNVGYTSFGTKNGLFYQGIEISLDKPFESESNPFKAGTRLSFFGVSFLKEYYEGDKSEFLFYALQYKTLLQVNPVQFGINKNSNLGTKTWFWKPEIGISYGIVNIAYAYNLPFKNTGDIKGGQLKISCSYPLVRIGKYK